MILHKYTDTSAMTSYALLDSFEQLVELPTRYLRHLKLLRRSEDSQHHIANVLKQHCQWIESSPCFADVAIDMAIQSLLAEEIVDWIIEQRHTGLTEATIHNRELLLREFYRWLTTSHSNWIRTDIPWGRSTTAKTPHTNLPRFVTMEQVIRLLNATHNESQRVALHFIFDTGLRVSELVRMTNDFLPNENDWPNEVNYYPLLVPGSKSPNGISFKYRYTIISRPMLARVRRYHSTLQYSLAKNFSLYDPKRPTFLNVHQEQLSKDSVQKTINDAWLRQGGLPREISPHRLRHGTALSILNSEFGKELIDNLLIVQSTFGHASIRTTERYTSIPIQAIRSIMGKREIRLKYEEAQQIFDATYLPGIQHTEKRGRR